MLLQKYIYISVYFLDFQPVLYIRCLAMTPTIPGVGSGVRHFLHEGQGPKGLVWGTTAFPL